MEWEQQNKYLVPGNKSSDRAYFIYKHGQYNECYDGVLVHTEPTPHICRQNESKNQTEPQTDTH